MLEVTIVVVVVVVVVAVAVAAFALLAANWYLIRDIGPISNSRDPIIQNHPPNCCTSQIISNAIFALSLRLVAIRLCTFDSIKPIKVTLLGWLNILVPGQKITSTDRGHSIIDNPDVNCPLGVNSTSIILRIRNHCFKYVVLIFPVSVIYFMVFIEGENKRQ